MPHKSVDEPLPGLQALSKKARGSRPARPQLSGLLHWEAVGEGPWPRAGSAPEDGGGVARTPSAALGLLPLCVLCFPCHSPAEGLCGQTHWPVTSTWAPIRPWGLVGAPAGQGPPALFLGSQLPLTHSGASFPGAGEGE